MRSDDEYDETIHPFTKKLAAIDASSYSSDPANPFCFLRNWTSPITDENLEVLAPSGKDDANALGKRMRAQYPHLFPPKWAGGPKDPNQLRFNSSDSAVFKVWTASSSRDIECVYIFHY